MWVGYRNLKESDAIKRKKHERLSLRKYFQKKEQFIRSCQRPTLPANQSPTYRGFVTLPCIQRTSERIASTQLFNINVAHKQV